VQQQHAESREHIGLARRRNALFVEASQRVAAGVLQKGKKVKALYCYSVEPVPRDEAPEPHVDSPRPHHGVGVRLDNMRRVLAELRG